MVTSISTLLLVSLLLCFSCSFRNVDAEQPSESQHSSSSSYVVPVNYLLRSDVCNPLPKVSKKGSFEVANKHGPCSKHNQGKASASTRSFYEQILRQDQARMNFIRSRRQNALKQTQDFSTPVGSVYAIGGSGNYFIQLGLGTPKQDVTVEIDTGSQITWTQCLPCSKGKCYEQLDPVFNPSKSKTFRNVTCSSSFCKQLQGSDCSSDSKSCIYAIDYGDGSGVSGSLAKEKLTITAVDEETSSSVLDFEFLCAHKATSGGFDSSGIMGLDRSPVGSFVSQTSKLYKRYFSFCLPAFNSLSPGYLTFGKTNDFDNKLVTFTPITRESEFYEIDIIGLSVAGEKLRLKSSLFQKDEPIIDSGTTISRLPTPAYTALKLAFRRKMTKYKMVKTSSTSYYDTCYDLSSHDTVKIPKISIFLKGDVELEADVRGILFPVNGAKEMCLAFHGNSDLNLSKVIIGNFQYQGIEVHHDVAGRRIGLGGRGC